MCETKSVTSALYLDMNEDLPDVSEWERIKELRGKSEDSKWTKKETDLLNEFNSMSDEELDKKIAVGHDYHFIGKVGQFCPIKDGCGGGLLMREKDGKYHSATGSKGFRWLESEMVKELDKSADIERSFYNQLVDEAVDTISKYGDFEWFVSEDPYVPSKKDVPPWLCPCGDNKYKSCFDCPNFNDDMFHLDCNLGYDISDIILKDETIKTNKK